MNNNRILKAWIVGWLDLWKENETTAGLMPGSSATPRFFVLELSGRHPNFPPIQQSGYAE